MKIILASKENFLLDKGYDLFGISRDKLKIGIVNTAFKTVEDLAYIEYIKNYYESMNTSGIDFKQFDIQGKTEAEILDFFSDRNVIQVSGGNVFYLLKVIRDVKFDLILKKLLGKGLNYISCSAGSYIMCPTVEVGSWKLGRNKYGITDYTALNYVPFLIKCHFTDDQKELLVEKKKTLKYPLRVLKNDQCFLLEDGKMEFIGNGEEIKL